MKASYMHLVAVHIMQCQDLVYLQEVVSMTYQHLYVRDHCDAQIKVTNKETISPGGTIQAANNCATIPLPITSQDVL